MTSTSDASSLPPEGGSFLKGSDEVSSPSFLSRSPLPKGGFGDLMLWCSRLQQAKRDQWQRYKARRKPRGKAKPLTKEKRNEYQRRYRAKAKQQKEALKDWNPNPALAREKAAAEARRRRYKQKLDRDKGIR